MSIIFFESLRDGIRFENVEIFLKWNTPLDELKLRGSPDIVDANGQTEIIWKDTILLDGIKGDWRVSCFPHELMGKFRRINLYLVGDKISLSSFESFKKHLLPLLGTPVITKELDDEKEIKWENEFIYVHLYLFEMHSFRLSLSIGLK